MMTGRQALIAARIEAAMQPFLQQQAGDIAFFAGMSEHMPDFKSLLDTAGPGVMDELCTCYPGFHRYAKVLERVAGAIQSGAIVVPQ